MAPLMVPMMSQLRFHGLKTHLNHMMNVHWVILMKLKMAYLKARHWEFEDEGIGYEEGMVIFIDEVLGSTLGASKM